MVLWFVDLFIESLKDLRFASLIALLYVVSAFLFLDCKLFVSRKRSSNLPVGHKFGLRTSRLLKQLLQKQLLRGEGLPGSDT